ncbi:MAG: gliding motility-associated C-terminal domain-containing protein [Chitinophagia bacterium]|nr:gliding motility-associated C-terminal domain-containing protein [Chitinophagia bacterium]
MLLMRRIFSLLLVVLAVAAKVTAQCLVTYIPINTGMDVTTFTALPTGTASTPSNDPHWIVVNATSSIAGASSAGSPASIIPRVGAWATNPATNPGQWISCLNSNAYFTDGTGTTAYNMTLGRTFKLCQNDSITINIYIANDNYISRIDVDGSIVLGFSQTASTSSTNYSTFTNFSQTIYLTAGTHRINVLCHNYNVSTAGSNPAGFDIYGTVSSLRGNPSIVYESDTSCASYACGSTSPCGIITLADTIRLCSDSSTVLSASLSGSDSLLSVNWSPTTGLSNPSIFNPTLTTTTSGWYRITTNSLQRRNLIPNGDFSHGFTAFTSGHSYRTSSTSPGQFGIGTNPRTFNGAWAAIGDHTTGSGSMLIVDGVTSAGVSTYCITIPVEPYTNYDLSAWFTNLYVTAPPNVTVSINGTTAFTINPTAVGTWVRGGSVWNSGAATTATICFYNTNLASFGNDFAMDDIALRKICTAIDSVYVNTNVRPIVLLGNDTAICAGSSVTFQSSVGYTAPTYLWSTGATTASISPTVTGSYWLAVTENGCVGRDTVNFVYKPNPIVRLGNDTGFCAGTSITANVPPAAGVSYLWNTGARTYSIAINTTGNYWVRVDSNGCQSTDSMRVNVSPNFPLFLGNDTSYCQSDPVYLHSIYTYPSSAFYLWNTGDITPTIATTTSGMYWLQVTQGYCVKRDSINIVITPDYAVRLGNDTTYCRPGAVTLAPLDTYPTGTTYLWSTGTTTNADVVNASGTYWLKVFENGCERIDSISIRIIYDSLVLFNRDTAICKGQFVQVIANNLMVGATYAIHWLPTAGIALPNTLLPLIRPDTSAMYRIDITTADCPPVADSFYIDVQPQPDVYLGGNKDVCRGDTLHLRGMVTPGWYSGYRYLWKPNNQLDDSTTLSVVFNAQDTAKLWLKVSTSAGCVGYDSAWLWVHPNHFNLLDTAMAICPHDSVVIQFNPSIPVQSYHWYPERYVADAKAGNTVLYPISNIKYHIAARSYFGCTDTGSVNIRVYPAAVISLPDTAQVYAGEKYAMNTISNCSYYSWFPTVGLDNPTAPNPTAMVGISTTYYVTGTTTDGCNAIDSISLIFTEEDVIKLPNAFTPGQSINNKFKVQLRGMASLNYFRIYNRWGNVVYESKDMQEGWDGIYNGETQPMGVYIYEVQAISHIGKVINKRGNVTLIR